MKLHHLSWRFLQRDWRSGELWLLVSALLLAVSVSTAIAVFSDRLQVALGRQVAEVMGGDVVIRSPYPVDKAILYAAEERNVASSTVIEFPSVVMAMDKMQMVSVKGVDNSYPLRGHIRTAAEPEGEDAITTDTPKPGTVWLEPRLFTLLDVEIGGQLMLGNRWLTIERAITLETDRGGDFYSLSPRVMFNLADLASTEIVQPGSRVNWKVLFAGELNDVDNFSQWATPQLKEHEKLEGANDSSRQLRHSVERLRQFLGLASIAAMLLAGVAIAMASQRFAQRRFDNVAVMRCLGAHRNDALTVLLGELLLLAIIIAPLGALLGWLLQEGVVQLLHGILPAWMPQARWLPLAVGSFTGVMTLLGFGLAPLLQLHDVSPLRVLKRDMSPTPASSWLVYTLSLGSVFLLLWYHTGEAVMALILAATSALMLLLISAAIQLGLRYIEQRGRIQQLPVYARTGVKRIVQGRGKTAAQLLSFTLTFIAMAVVLILRTDLISRWQQQMPDDMHNFFAMNIQTHQLDSYQQVLDEYGIDHGYIYPMVRGRLVQINGTPAQDAVPADEKDSHTLNRELNMTWSAELPEGNRVVDGEWWPEGATQGVSVEQELAERFALSVGDTLTFNIGGVMVTQPILSIRSLQWESFRPNFFMVFAPSVLDDFSATWLNSFKLEQEDKWVLGSIVRELPTVTLLDFDAIIQQVQTMLGQSTVAVEAMLAALLVAGLLVMVAVIESSIDERLQEGALIRSLGGSKRQLLLMQIGEFVLFGLLSGLLAAAGAELCSYLLSGFVFEMAWQPVWWVWYALPLSGAFVLGGVGWLGIRRVINQSPMTVLKAL